METQSDVHHNPTRSDVRTVEIPGADALPSAAQRALVEANARRRETELAVSSTEVGGRGGLDPVRFGDWEVKGLTSDF